MDSQSEVGTNLSLKDIHALVNEKSLDEPRYISMGLGDQVKQIPDVALKLVRVKDDLQGEMLLLDQQTVCPTQSPEELKAAYESQQYNDGITGFHAAIFPDGRIVGNLNSEPETQFLSESFGKHPAIEDTKNKDVYTGDQTAEKVTHFNNQVKNALRLFLNS